MSFASALTLSPPARNTAPPERRMSMRVATILPVELVFSNFAGSVLPAHTVDVGMAGICVQTASIIDPQAVRSVRMTLGDHRFELKVHSRWSSDSLSNDGPLTGLAFDSIDSPTKAALWDCIQQRGQELSTFLGSCDGLDQLPFEETFELALTTRLRNLQSGQLIYDAENQRASESIYALMCGSVLLESGEGRRNQQISDVSPREFFGGLPIIAGCAPFERAVVVENCTILEFLGYNVEYLLRAKPGLGVSLLRAASYHWIRRYAETLDERMLSV